MPQSLSAVYIHLVFSTKERQPFLQDRDTRESLQSPSPLQKRTCPEQPDGP